MKTVVVAIIANLALAAHVASHINIVTTVVFHSTVVFCVVCSTTFKSYKKRGDATWIKRS